MGKKLTKEQFIKQAREIHGGKYDYSKVDYVNSQTKVCIICPIHGEFWKTPNKHLVGQGCKLCTYDDLASKRSKTTEEFVEEARKIHGERYDYSKVNYINNHTKVCIVCPNHGEFWQIPSVHLNGERCNKCANYLRGKFKRSNRDEFIKKAREVHGNKYDYSKVEYINTETKVCIICPIHGEFWQTPHMHIGNKKRGCPMCGGSKKLTKEEFIEKARAVHGDKYDYSKVEYKGNKTKVCIICPIHGEFWQKPNSHLRGCGCASCSNSHLEGIVSNTLITNNVTYVKEKVFEWLNMKKFDFYLPQYNIAIECQGEQHFKPVKWFGGNEAFNASKRRDELKIQKCKENGVKLYHYFEDKKYFGTYENEIHSIEELKKVLRT